MSDAQAMPRYRPSPRAAAAGAEREVLAAAATSADAVDAPATPPPSLALAVSTAARSGRGRGIVAAFEALGADDDARLAAWVASQLAPIAADDTDVSPGATQRPRSAIPSPGFTTLGKSLTQLWQDHRPVGNAAQPPGRGDPALHLPAHGLQQVAAARGAGRLLAEPLQRLRLRDVHPGDASSTTTATSSGPTSSATSAPCSRP